MIGGGDVKLLFMASLYLRGQTPVYLFTAAVFTAAGGVLLLLKRGTLLRRFFVLIDYVKECVSRSVLLPYPFTTEQEKKEGGIAAAYGFFLSYLVMTLYQM